VYQEKCVDARPCSFGRATPDYSVESMTKGGIPGWDAPALGKIKKIKDYHYLEKGSGSSLTN